MKTPKTLGFVAAAWAALACVTTQTAYAASGDIMAIERYAGSDSVNEDLTPETALTAGQKVMFRFRLLNRDVVGAYSNAYYHVDWYNPWYQKYVGPGGTNEAALASVRNPLQVGVWMGNRMKPATVESIGAAMLGETPSRYFTDIICSYVVEPGDFALPLKLAARAGSVPVMAGTTPSASDYWLSNAAFPANYWNIWQDLADASLGGAGKANFWLGTLADHEAEETGRWRVDDAYSAAQTEYDQLGGAGMTSSDMSSLGIYVKAIDFDEAMHDAENWRQISAGTTSASPTMPALAIPGGVAGTNTVTLYVWTPDTNVAVMAANTNLYVSVDPTTTPWTTNRYWVSTVKAKPGDTSVTFPIWTAPDATNKTATVYLSASPTNSYVQATDNPVTYAIVPDFVTRQIVVGPPPEPSLTVTVNAQDHDTVPAAADTANSAVATLNVSLPEGQTFTNDMVVTITPAMVDSTCPDGAFDFIGVSASATGDPLGTVTTITIPKGRTAPLLPLYVYARRATTNTFETLGQGIRFTASVDPASDAYGFVKDRNSPATLYISKTDPTIVAPLEGASVAHVPGGNDHTFEIEVSDAAGEMASPAKYTVYWSNTGNGIYEKKEDLTPVGGVLTITTKYMTGGTFNTQFYVVNQDGYKSAVRTISVQVDEPRVITLAADHSSLQYVEGGQAEVTITLSEAFSTAAEGYLFLVPQTEASSNLVTCTQFTTGALVMNGDRTHTEKIYLDFLDNCSGEPFKFIATLRSKSNIEEGDAIGGFASRTLLLNVTNKFPRVERVYMGTRTLPDGSDTMEEQVAQGVPKTFRVGLADDVALDLTNLSFTTEWSFENGLVVTNLYGDPTTNKFSYAFSSPGRKKVTVRLKDKDMSAGDFERAPVYTFYVNVLDEPTIAVIPDLGSAYLTENDANTSSARFRVILNVPPSQKITAAITVTNADDSVGGPLPKLNTYFVDFKANQMTNYFTITELDGTVKSENIGFRFSAAITNETIVPDSGGKMWKNYYASEPYSPLYVHNVAPTIGGDPPSSVATNEASLNVPYTIHWTAKDVLPDMTNNLTATWTVVGEGTTTQPIVNPNKRLYEGTFTFTFTKTGGGEYREVVLQLSDKDAGTEEYFDTRRYIFHVAPQKTVEVIPHGAHPKGQTALSQKYVRMRNKDGLGAGRVWADGNLSIITGFKQKWNYAPDDAVAWVYAYGYRAGEADDGQLQPVSGLISGTQLGMNEAGDSATAAPWYTWQSEKDSFFYCWLSTGSEGEESSGDGAHLGVPSPVVGTNALAVSGQQRVSINVEVKDDEHPTYDPVLVEAIFAKEWRVEDNVGDLNQDGIPDVYAVDYAWGNGLLYEAAGYTLEDGGDVADLKNWNGDTVSTSIGQTVSGETGDFLPSMTSAGNGSLIPNVKSKWALYGQPFTAYLEIRGFGEGLNYRQDASGTQGPNSSGAWIGGRDFTEVESNAWDTVYGLDPDWTPENRTDPTVDDTDGDGLPDGYEYYFWYHAYVGDPETGTRLTGSRFNLADIANGTPISSDDIAAAFNPNVASGTPIAERDTDGDGLTDLEELALGTNPLHWDTDGDGLSDYWEVLRGLDPLVVEAADSNPDGDFMARAEIGKDYAVLSFTDADGNTRMYAVPNNGVNLVDPDSLAVLETATNAAAGIPVFRYGGPNAPVAPVSRGVWEKSDELTSVTGGTYFEYTCAEKPTAVKAIDWTGLDDISNVTVRLDQTLIVIHDQVMAEFGFDPRTAWFQNTSGRVHDRWSKEEGTAANTAPYTTFDEYLLLKYRYMTAVQEGNAASILPGFAKNNPSDPSDKTYSLARDLAALKSKKDTLGNIFVCGTTNPNIPYSKVYTEENGTEYADENHGADTSEDGVPDGWTLYVGFNPNKGAKNNTKIFDGTGLGLAAQFAGTDSCAAYKDVETIAANNPADTTGWINKFWPVNPWNGDTDGDRIRDDVEGGRWNGIYRYGQTVGFDYSFTFVYTPDAASETTHCVRGGGMNPCTVDTDGDRLPDTWEMCFAGLLFEASGKPLVDSHNPSVLASLGDQALELIRRGDGLAAGASAAGAYIAGGMDATDPNDAFGIVADTRTGTNRDTDFDHDGLQNFQEYLVQVLRHLRYDDSVTPLMGRWMPGGSAASETFVKFIPMNYMDDESFRTIAMAAGFNNFTTENYLGTLGYFARPPRAWDPAAFWTGTLGVSAYDAMSGGYRVMLPPSITLIDGSILPASGYASTDPRLWDTDGDNMDDYYELFHGLNPLLGSVKDATKIAGDVIARIYDGAASFWYNAWTGWPNPLMEMPDWLGEDAYPYFDAMKYPWMMGTPEADADGDGIRNLEEALVVNMTSPQPTHTDPTPLWMTDSTSYSLASYTAQYYNKDLDLDLYWNFQPGTIQTTDGATASYLFTFEENEGYDTDHDGIPDNEEQQLTSTPKSDPQLFADPDRRQAIWFPGEKSAAVSRTTDFHRTNFQSYDTFRQFTVEAWIKPEALDRAQTILERSAVYGASTLSNNLAQVRANFRIGIDTNGCLYGCFDTNDAVPAGEAGQTAIARGMKKLTGDWTHVALSYDGAALKLYMNGSLLATEPTGLIPANGLIDYVEDALPNMANFPVLGNGYVSVPCAVVLGAHALDRKAFGINNKTDWTSFTDFYAGYLDEVRVWDGARTADDIVADMERRYTFADVSAQRDEVYAAWAGGATRNDNDGKAMLPPELVLHYNFQTLPGATNAADVAWEPSGFTKNVRDNDRIQGWNVPGDIYCGWWYTAKNVRSTVYRNWRLVPWIPNTVGHLPPLDGSAPDSEYWSKWYGGLTAARELDVDEIVFPNTATPYPYVLFQADRYYHQQNLVRKQQLGLVSADVVKKYDFDLRTAVVGTSDLVPLGGAFAKRCEEMWDGQGAADAWAMTKRDSNANGIPDWWETLAKASYGAGDGFGWTDLVTYDGREMTAREAYLRDIQKGMLPDGSVNGTFVDNVMIGNIPKWWSEFVGLTGTGADDDDNDGLSNYAEYLISEVYTNFDIRLNPLSASTDGVTPDYWRTVTVDGKRRYLGELFTDHDHMDNDWEDAYDIAYVNSTIWDATADPDGDGWRNWSEFAAFTDPSLEAALSLVAGEAKEDQRLPEYPIPTIRVKVSYNGVSDAFNGKLVVKAWHGSAISGKPDASWTVAGPDSPSISCSRFIGVNPNRKVRLNFGAGMVAEQHCSITFFDPHEEHWHYNDDGGVDEVEAFDIDTAHWHGCNDITWNDDPTVHPNGTSSAAFGYGYVDYRTGDVEIDFTKFQDSRFGIVVGDNEVAYLDLRRSFVRVNWMSRVVTKGNTKEFHLSLPDEDAGTLGFLREGKTTFIVFADANGNGVCDAGEPYGFVRDVDVGWDEVPEVPVLLTDDDAGLRFTVPGEGIQRVSVVRTAINGTASRQRTVWSRKVDLDVRSWFAEADFMDADSFDFDWKFLCEDAAKLAIAPDDIRTATYEIRVANSSDGIVSFTRTFDAARAKPVAVSPSASAVRQVYTVRPEFVWTGSDEMSAFQLQIARDAEFADIVWDSGTNFLSASGNRAWKAPVYVGEELEDGTNYFWRVAEMNARYQSPGAFWSDPAEFLTRVNCRGVDVTGGASLATGYSGLELDVRYYGPCAVPATNVIVGVYENADFTGYPAARLRLAGDKTVESLTNNVTAYIFYRFNPANDGVVTVSGLAPGSYYAMAFIDLNTNGVRDAFEPWGYVKNEAEAGARQRPGTILVESSAVKLPNAVILMEDTDVNGNDTPDCLEDLTLFAGASGAGDAAIDDTRDSDLDGLSDVVEDASGTDSSIWDTDGDGMPDGWEVSFAGTDPLTADADLVDAGDVMAYAVTNLTVITVWDGVNEISATNRYVVMAANRQISVGDDAAALADVLRHTYDYAGQDGLGMAVEAAELAGQRVFFTTNAEVVLVHAQVYDAFGFSPLTANPSVTEEDAVNTKPFTALDKYLVCRYLEKAYGLADEAAMNTNGTWSACTLKPGDADNNKDGVPDGWELYVMFGTDGTAASPAEAKISPFKTGVEAAEYVRDAANTPDGGGLSILNEYDCGNVPTNPWNVDTDGDGITDSVAYRYGIGGGRANTDADNDGLSNWAEYLADLAGYLPDGSYTNMFSKAADGQIVPDYFLLGSDDKYLGFLYGDSDFMEDWLEDEYDPDMLSRYVFDAWDDPDDDGWSNWAEVRAGTDPTSQNKAGIDGYPEIGHPVPAISLTLVQESGTMNAPVYVQAYPDGALDDMPDALWNIGTGATSERYLGFNPGVKQTLTLGPCEPGSVNFEFKSVMWENHKEITRTTLDRYGNTLGRVLLPGSGTTVHVVPDSEWRTAINDKPNASDPTTGQLRWGFTLAEADSTLDESSSLVVGTINYVTGEAVVDFSKCLGPRSYGAESPDAQTETKEDGTTIITKERSWDVCPSDEAWVKATWESVVPKGQWRHTVYLATPEPAELGVSRGMLREGKTTFTAFLDEDGDGKYTPGEPYGIVSGVDVGWFGTSCEIELTRTSAQIARLNVSAGLGDFTSANAATDRKVVGAPTAANVPSGLTPTGDLSTKVTRMRILRTRVNGMRETTELTNAFEEVTTFDALVFDRYVDISTHPLLTEANIRAAGGYALDWGTLTNAWLSTGRGDIGSLTNAAYRIVLGEGDTAISDEGAGNGLSFLFVNTFESGLEQTLAQPTAPAGKVHSARPTFRWTHPNTIDKRYPAFRLRVWDEADELVYDSGVQPVPPRTDDGEYAWTAPLCAGMVTPEGKVFGATGTYKWAVSMLDAKFTEPNAAEVVRAFEMDATGMLGGDSDYGALDVAVRYYGPVTATDDAATMTNIVRVQAFETPDFTGDPAGEAYVTNIADLASTTDLTANARIPGLKPGAYYVRAFIDSDADCAWSRWETWGYCNYVGTDDRHLYTPRAVRVAAGEATAVATVFMEDMDTNNNQIPDALEYEQKGTLGSSGIVLTTATGTAFIPEDGGQMLETPEDLGAVDVTLAPAPSALDRSVTLTFTLTRVTSSLADLPALEGEGVTETTEEGTEGVKRVFTLSNVTEATTRVRLTDLDGTDGSAYLLTVSSDATDLYWPGSLRLTVTNNAPAVTGAWPNDSVTNAVLVHLGETFSIAAAVDDVAADLAAGLHVYWQGEGLASVDGTATIVTSNVLEVVTNGVTFTTNRVDKTFNLAFSGGSSGLRAATLVAEDKDGGVATRNYYYYVVAPRDDFDNDGLSNYVEDELAAADLLAGSYTNMFTFAADGQIVPDYFLPYTGGNYLGFVFTDHDFMDDWWEDLFEDPDMLSRYTFDAWDDPDDDGWSNWAEARAGTDPTWQNEAGVDGNALPGHPVPEIDLTVSLAGGDAFPANMPVIVTATADGRFDGMPDAKWTVSTGGSNTRYLGSNPNTTVEMTLGPGAIEPGTVYLNFKSPVFWNYNRTYKNGRGISGTGTFGWMSDWIGGAKDCPDLNDSTKGLLVWGGNDNAAEAVGTVDYRTGKVVIYFERCNDGMTVVGESTTSTSENGDVVETRNWTEYPSVNAWFEIRWKSVMATGNTRQTLRLSTPELAEKDVSNGMVREGKNTFTAFLDEDGDGKYTPGEPYGAVSGVDVGWFGTSCEIELSRTAPQTVRVNLSAPTATDRGTVGYPAITNVASYLTAQGVNTRNVRLRVLRTMVNGEANASTNELTISYDGLLVDRYVDIIQHPLLTEADLLAAGQLDLDWDTLTNLWREVGNETDSTLTNAAYRIVLGEGDTEISEDGTGIGLSFLFVNGFEAERTPAVQVSPTREDRIYAASPTFRWTHANSIGKSYPAFRLRVWSEDGESLVYDSGARQAPMRDANGVYEWTAPIYAGMATPQGVIFATNTTYCWSVSMLDAKFTGPDDEEEKKDGKFRLATQGEGSLGLTSDYGAVKVCVRYYGPAMVTNEVENLTNVIHVQAFTSPDFTGDPATEAYVTNVADIASTTDLTANAVLLGLKPGSYYVRAFIDSDGTGDWARWKTWGYCNYVGTEEPFLYAPRAVRVAPGELTPEAVVYMEDMDTNNDGVADAQEVDQKGVIGSFKIRIVAPGGAQGVMEDAEGLDLVLKPAPSSIPTNVTLTLTVTRAAGSVAPLPVFDAPNLVLVQAETNGSDVVSRTYTLTDVTNETTRLNFLWLDGMAGAAFDIVADADVRDRYQRGKTSLSVVNVPPTIVGEDDDDATVTTNVVKIGDAFTIPLAVTDVEADLAAGLAVTWRGASLASADGSAAIVSGVGRAIVTNGNAIVTDSATKNYSLMFTSGRSGVRTITLQVADKDGGVAERVYLYEVISPKDDLDNDGLSNEAENLIKDGFGAYGFWQVDFMDTFTFGQAVPDYFLRVGKLYLGEMFADHDFMEDDWEDAFDPDMVSRYKFDPWHDPDDDGWSNYAECRAGTDPTATTALLLDGETMTQVPTPTIRLKANYRGAAMPNATLVVLAYGEIQTDGAPDAIWTVSASDPQDLTRNLGLNPGAMQQLNLGPGSVVPGSVNVEFRDPNALANDPEVGAVWQSPSLTTWQAGLTEYFEPSESMVGKLVRVTGDDQVGTIDYKTGDVLLDFSMLQDYLYASDNLHWFTSSEDLPSGSNEWVRLNLAKSFVRVSWKGMVATDGRSWTTALATPTWGRLREGKTKFVVYATENASGDWKTWTPGEPLGIVEDVDVGWSGTTVEVELTDTNPSMVRIDLSSALSAGDFATANACTDRGNRIVGGPGANQHNYASEFIGTNVTSAADMRVRIIRSRINETWSDVRSNSIDEVVFDKTFDTTRQPYLTEADLYATGQFDLDWDQLLAAWSRDMSGSKDNLTNVTYRLVIGDGTIATDELNNLYPVLFRNVFERGAQQTLADPVEPKGTIHSARPTFRWKHENSIAKEYPAFRLRVWTAKTGGTLVYDSGSQLAPARDSYGIYSWTAPIYADMVTPQGVLFANTNNYFWSVSMLDAKFKTVNSSETRQEFRLEVSGAIGTISDYGAIKACVRYFGPAAVTSSLSSPKGLIRVQAFASPDFTGVPAGEGYVTNVTDIASTNSLTANAVILGLKPGTYYVRAFIDTDGDFAWSRWDVRGEPLRGESWGYYNYVGTAVTALYTPRPVTVAAGQAVPEAVVYMEDMDGDNDGLPDAWEWEQGSGTTLDTLSSPTGNTFFTKVNTNLANQVAAYTKLFGGGSTETATTPIRLMSALVSGTEIDAQAAAIALLTPDSLPALDEDAVQVRIDSFSLDNGVTLTVSSELTPGDYGIITVVDQAKVAVRLLASKTPDFADAQPVTVKVMTVTANEPLAAITGEEVQEAIRANGLGGSAFFKVELVQVQE